MADYNSAYTGAQIDANLALAATATQPGDLATVATTGAYGDLTGKPTLGTAAAAATGDFATAAQGALADTAVQPGANANVLGSGSATDNFVLTADGAGGAAWEVASGGGGTPGGTDTQVQFNDGGAFGGDSGFTFDKTNNTLGLGGGTITASDPIIDMAQTWNNGAVAFTAVKANVTDTASAAGSLLMDLQVNGVSKFSVTRAGRVTAGSGASNNMIFVPVDNALTVGIGGVSAGGIRHISGSSITLLAGTGYSTTHTADAMLNGASGLVGWHAGGYSFSNLTPDLALARDAANTLAQRNGVNAQAFNLYNLFSTVSDYDRGTIKWSSNVLLIDTENAGTSTVKRHIRIGTANTGVGLSGGNAAGVYAVAVGNSQAANNYTFAAGESSATGAGSVAMGRGAGASGANTVALGYLTQAYQANQFAFSGRWHSGGGDCQMSMFVLGATTTDVAATEMSTSHLGTTRIIVRASTTWAFEITVVGRSAGGTDNAMYMYRGMIKRDASNNTILVGTVDNFYTNETNAAWDVAVTADDTNEALKVEVTGAAATNINWTAKVILTEVGRA